MASFDFPPDWRAGMVERWQYLTDVLVAWDGTEQRRMLRGWPRIELEFEAFCAGASAAALPAWLNAHQTELFTVPYWPGGGTALFNGRFLEPVEAKWRTPQLARCAAKIRLIDLLPAPSGTVDQIGGHDAFYDPHPDWAQPLPDQWRRLLEILDLQTGLIRVTDRAGFSRRRWTLEYLVAGADVARLRAFVWRRFGRLVPCWLPAPEGGLVWCRLDTDEIEWRWLTPEVCRCTLGALTLPDEV
jgi:hypothetical protein